MLTLDDAYDITRPPAAPSAAEIKARAAAITNAPHHIAPDALNNAMAREYRQAVTDLSYAACVLAACKTGASARGAITTAREALLALDALVAGVA